MVKLRGAASAITPSPPLSRLRRDARIELVPHDDEALVAAFADQIDAVMGLDLEA